MTRDSTLLRDGVHVVAHVAVTLDGATTGFDVDLASFYGIAATWSEDLTLVGADTILAQAGSLADTPGPGPATDGPLLAVVDGRGRLSSWDALRNAGYWRDVVALHAADTPPRAPDRGVEEIVTGGGRVDLAAALSQLRSTYGVRTVRVDSGGGLIGALLDADLIDELSLLIHPIILAEGTPTRWWGEVSRTRRWMLRSSHVRGEQLWLRFDRAASD
jgi:2,5-diamino-6-(ribosylamino)-4(3H)-pyrimidinone 5'-phosphate reductase